MIAALRALFAAGPGEVNLASPVPDPTYFTKLSAGRRQFLLKYAQVGDKYHRPGRLPPSHPYPHGCPRGNRSLGKDIRARLSEAPEAR